VGIGSFDDHASFAGVRIEGEAREPGLQPTATARPPSPRGQP
jgi:hypothetical protein